MVSKEWIDSINSWTNSWIQFYSSIHHQLTYCRLQECDFNRKNKSPIQEQFITWNQRNRTNKTKNIVESHKQMYQNTLHSIVFAMTRSLYTSWKKRSSPLQMKRMEPRSLPFYVTSPYYATMGHYIHLCILLFMMWLWKWYRTRRSFTIRMIFLTIHRSLFIYCSWPLSQNFVDLSSRELKYMIVEEFDWVEANGV